METLGILLGGLIYKFESLDSSKLCVTENILAKRNHSYSWLSSST